MPHPVVPNRIVARRALPCVCALLISAGVVAAIKNPIKKPTLDPSAESVELFEGIDKGVYDVTVIPKSSLEGNVFIENKSSKPLTVKLPPAVTAVQVLKQGFGAGGAGAGAGAGGGLGGGNNNQGGQQAQSMGGGMMGGGMGGMGGGGMGMGRGMFSIPPQKVVQVPLKSVCLAHGKAEPRPQMTYKLVKLETYTKDPVLQELLINFGNGNVDQHAAQAAAWNVTDKMSWQELSQKQITFLGGLPPKPYFTQAQLMAAQQLVATAQQKAREREDAPKSESVPTPKL